MSEKAKMRRLENHFETFRLSEGADFALEMMQMANELEVTICLCFFIIGSLRGPGGFFTFSEAHSLWTKPLRIRSLCTGRGEAEAPWGCGVPHPERAAGAQGEGGFRQGQEEGGQEGGQEEEVRRCEARTSCLSGRGGSLLEGDECR